MKFETANIKLPKIISETIFQKDMEIDSPLPEFNPDISRLIRVDAKANVDNIDCGGENCEVQGRIVYGLLYETDYKNKLSYATVSSDFVQKIDLGGLKFAEIYPSAEINCLYLTCKLLGSRKFVIKSKVQTCFKAMGNVLVNAVDINTSDINTYYRTEDIETVKVYDSYNDEIKFKETVKTEKPVGSVINVTYNNTEPEILINGEKTVIKTNITVKTLYEVEDTDNEYIFSSETFPVSVSIAAPRTAEDDQVTADISVASISVVPDLDEYGENRVLNINYSIGVTALYMENTVETIAADGFSGKNEYECDYSRVIFDNHQKSIVKTFIYEKSYTSENSMINEILDTSVNFNISDKITEGNMLKLRGMTVVDVLASTGEGIVNLTFNSDFEEILPINEGSSLSTVSLKPFETNASLYGGNTVNIRILGGISSVLYEIKEQNIMKNFETGAVAEVVKRGICFYYPDNDEDLWSISRKYRQNPKKLHDDNKDAFDEYGVMKKNRKFLAIK